LAAGVSPGFSQLGARTREFFTRHNDQFFAVDRAQSATFAHIMIQIPTPAGSMTIRDYYFVRKKKISRFFSPEKKLSCSALPQRNFPESGRGRLFFRFRFVFAEEFRWFAVPSWAISSKFWHFCARCGAFVFVLALFKFLRVLALFCAFWHFCVSFGNFAQVLTLFASFWGPAQVLVSPGESGRAFGDGAGT
jgi:hypothetical protein